MKFLASTMLTVMFSMSAAYAVDPVVGSQKQIEAVFNFNLRQDLLQTRQSDLAKMRSLNKDVNSQIAAANRRALAELNAYSTDRQVSGRLNAITFEQAETVLNSIYRHPVVSDYEYARYNRPGVEIGFCFGRAAYAHLALLQIGVNKDSIKKIWAVGPMQTAAIAWDFHVATLVKSTDGKWLVIDSFVGQVMTVEQWIQEIDRISQPGHRNRYYFSSPKKFSVSLGTYDRIQLGLDLTPEQDWYRGYFSDLMKWFREGQLESVGLSRLK